MLRFLVRFKTATTAVVLLLISLVAMSSKINTNRFYFRTFLFSTLFKVESTVLITLESIKNVFVNVSRIRSLEDRLDNAEQRLLNYRELTFLYDQIQQENDQLRNLLKIRERISYPAHYSKVVFRDPSFLSDHLIVDKGFDDGVRINMPVVYSSETNERLVLVGKIIEVSPQISKVRLLSARNLYLSVRLDRSGYTGISRGQGSWNQNLLLDYIPINAKISIGEQVITSGESEVYPPNLLVGEIQGTGRNAIEEFFQTVYVRPEFDYKRIRDVFILEYTSQISTTNLTEETYER